MSIAASVGQNPKLLAACDHIVQFYEKDGPLVDCVADYLAKGLRTGATCVVLATESHRNGFEQRLMAAGFDMAAARADLRAAWSGVARHGLIPLTSVNCSDARDCTASGRALRSHHPRAVRRNPPPFAVRCND